jgi:hypothetical protein
MARFIIDIPTEDIKSKKLSEEICDFLNQKYGVVSVHTVEEENVGQFYSIGQEENDNKAVEVLKALMVVQEVERKEKALKDPAYK